MQRQPDIQALREQSTRKLVLRVEIDDFTDERMLRLKHLVAAFAGPCVMELELVAPRYACEIGFSDKFSVRADDNLKFELDRLFGKEVAHFA